MLGQIRKALVPVGVGVCLAALGYFGVLPTPDVIAVVTTVVTAILVYLIPNDK